MSTVSIDGPQEFIAANIVGTFTLLQEALRYWRKLPRETAEQFRFLHVSTDEVFGSLGQDGLFTEESPYRPNSPYSASKAASDHPSGRGLFQPTGCRLSSPIAPTITGPISFPRSLFPS